MIETLASDDLAGRDNGTPGSAAAQDFLIAQLAEFAQPLVARGNSVPMHSDNAFDVGTNVVGVIPGGDLADQYVIVGAHYDHLGSDCTGSGPADDICNGATDNASGVAVALAVARSIAGDEEAQRRSVVIALWDAEEDGLARLGRLSGEPSGPAGADRRIRELRHAGHQHLPVAEKRHGAGRCRDGRAKPRQLGEGRNGSVDVGHRDVEPAVRAGSQ